MTPAEVFARFVERPQDVRVIAPRRDGAAVENHALRFARSMGMQIEGTAPTPRQAMTAAQAFDKLSTQQALQHFPELEGAYQQLAAAKKFADRLPNQDAQQKSLDLVRMRISQTLHEGKEIGVMPTKGRER